VNNSNKHMDETLSQIIERLLAADAEYKAFVRTTRSHQLACEGAHEAIATLPQLSAALPVSEL